MAPRMFYAVAALLALSLQTQGGTIELGQTVTGQLAAGEEARYTYSGAAGEAIYVVLRAASGDWDPVLEIYAPSGDLLAFDDDAAGGRDAAVRDLVLPADGDYTLVVRSYGNRGGGAYALTLERGVTPPTPVVGGGSIMLDQSVVGELVQGGQQDFWVFNGEAGQRVSIAMQSAQIDSVVRLNAPDGTELIADDDSGGNRDALIFDFTLPQTGVYMIVARAFDSAQTGQYRLSLLSGAATPAPPTPTPVPTPVVIGSLSAGVTVERDLEPGANDGWTFEGRAGEVVSLYLESDDFDAYLSVYDPDGVSVASDDDLGPGTDALIYSLPVMVDGVYTAVAGSYDGVGSGAYTLTFYRDAVIPATVGARGELTPGVAETGNLGAGQVHLWTFRLEAGATAEVTAAATAGGLYQVDLELANLLTGETVQGSGSVTAPLKEAGEYVVYAYAFGDQAGFYEITLTLSDLPAIGGGQIAVGQAVEAYLEVGARDTWTLTGPYDTPLAVAMMGGGSQPFDTYLEVYAPDGAQVAVDDDNGPGYNALLVGLQLTEPGDYSIVARGFNDTVGGLYTLSVSEMGNIELGQTVAGELRAPEDSDAWAFLVRERVAVNVEVAGAEGFAPIVQLHDIYGYYVTESYDGVIQNYPLREPGLYSLIVVTYEGAGAYELTVSRGELPRDLGGPITYGQRVTGELVAIGQSDTWTFTAGAGDAISAVLESPAFDTYLELYDANGALLTENDDDGTSTNSLLSGYRLPGAGEYRLVVRGYSHTETGRYELALYLGSEPPTLPGFDGRVEMGQTVQGEIAAPGQRDTWRFNLQADSTFSITLQGDEAIAGDLYVYIYDVDGYRIQSSRAGDPALSNIYAAQTGEYRAVVDVFGDGAGAYSLTLGQAMTPPTPVPTQTGAVPVGEEVTGDLAYGARHAWALAVAEDVTVNITLRSQRGSELDTYLYLLGPDGAEIISNDDSAGGTDSALMDVALTGGETYTVVVGSYADSGEGGYVLSVQPVSGAVQGGGQIGYGTVIQGGPIAPGQRDTWRFQADAGDVATITLTSPDFDAFLELYDEAGNLLITDDDGGGDLNAAIRSFRLARSGLYTIVARSLNRDASGVYTLTLEWAGREP